MVYYLDFVNQLSQIILFFIWKAFGCFGFASLRQCAFVYNGGIRILILKK